MMNEINETHDENLKSWIESANDPSTDFPIQNLPFCVFKRTETRERIRNGVVIGDQIFDLGLGYQTKLFEDKGLAVALCSDGETNFNHVARSSDPAYVIEFRQRATELFGENANPHIKKLVQRCLIPINEAEFFPPFKIVDYTDFYCSLYHATNVGKLFRPDNPLLENYKYIPIGYHGRASSIIISGTDFKRPQGQNRNDVEKPPVYMPSKALDYEMEVGFFVSKGTKIGETIPIEKAEEHIFGLCLVNDWSARDLQGWEYQPLGPFLGKSFATTISPFVVTMEALAPFRVPDFNREEGDPKPLDYLSDETNEKFGGIDLKLEVYIQSRKMRAENIEPSLLSRSNLKDLYWTIGQMLAHHNSNGCNLSIGDLMASGTVSGKGDNERGCLLEITKRGKEPVELPSGEIRRFLENYDEIIMKGYCERNGFRKIGFGECRGMVLPAG